MMCLADGELSPKIDPTARIAPNAVISGDVAIGPNTSVGFGAVLVAESGPVRIAGNSVIMEQAILRGVRDHPIQIAEHVLIGPHARLTGCTVGAEAFIATGVTVLNGAVIGPRAEIRINGIVHIRTSLPADAMVPPGWIAVGDPVQVYPPDCHDQIWAVQKTLDFPGTVFGVDRPADGETFMSDVMPRYAGYLRRRFAGDEQVPNG